MTTRKPDIVGTGDIADRLHVTDKAVEQWRAKQGFPDPDWRISRKYVPVWLWSNVERWCGRTGLPKGPWGRPRKSSAEESEGRQ